MRDERDEKRQRDGNEQPAVTLRLRRAYLGLRARAGSDGDQRSLSDVCSEARSSDYQELCNACESNGL